VYLLEPNETPYDLRFRLFGIPVRVHPLFWLLGIFIAMNFPPKIALISVGVMFVSILVHELGHALVIRFFGNRPWIVLWVFGGLAMSHRQRDPRRDIAISLAGPLAGFLLAGLTAAVVFLTGHEVRWSSYWPFFVTNVEGNAGVVVLFLLLYNIWWGLFNLLPIMPLDGGQVLREVLLLLRRPNFLVEAAQVSVVFAMLLVAYALVYLREPFMAMMCGSLAYQNFALIQTYGGGHRW